MFVCVCINVFVWYPYTNVSVSYVYVFTGILGGGIVRAFVRGSVGAFACLCQNSSSHSCRKRDQFFQL